MRLNTFASSALVFSFVFASFLLVVACGAQIATQVTVQSDAQQKISVSSDLVVLPVTVKDRNGNVVAGLTQNDFRVFDDDVEQTIDVFTSEASPLSLVILIDDDLKVRDAEQTTASLRSIAAGVSLMDEAMVCRFDLLFYRGDAFTNDGDRLLVDLKDAQKASGPSKAGPVPFVTPPSTHTPTNGEASRVAPVNMGAAPTKALHDAIFGATELLHDRGRNRRKVILLVSDGINGSAFNRHTYEETIGALLSENISVFSVAVGRNSFHRKFAVMRDYAAQSGGDVFYVSTTEQMEKLYSRIIEQARHEYTLAYVPRGSQAASTYHLLRVETLQRSFTVETRRGYYATVQAPDPNK